MSSEGGDESGKDLRFFILFILGLFFLWAITGAGGDGGVFGTASSTDSGATTTEDSNLTTPESSAFNHRDTREEIRSAAREVDRLREEVRTAKIWGTHSALAGSVRLSAGDVYSDDEDEEYLVVSAQQYSDEPIDISGFRIESYVTGASALIPQGAQVLETGRVNAVGPINLYSGDRAVLTSGVSPVGISFGEHVCTGYLDQFQDFYPSLPRSCPAPEQALRESGGVALDDDSCYEYVRTLPQCRMAVTDLSEVRPRLSSACRGFIENQLTYNGCVSMYRYKADFLDGDWRVFLGKQDELWRSEREIIRLLDREGKTIDVLEY